ncbi:cytochrome c oxidase subunit I [Bacillus piscicola]|uniref:cytochrome c oxidase subunit I n=1 Tax=Bacillus piscicola TaxID=1632684 RepID=UPI001F09E6D4|nr:cbb3-type cytochrome c oxidase subunit I [Bacillus piscicola]
MYSIPFFNTEIKLASDIIFGYITAFILGGGALFFITYKKKWLILWGWIRTTDHLKIGIMYLAAACAFLLRGGLDAMFMRMQLAFPNIDFWVFQGEKYNQMMTTHGTLMIFFVVMPFLFGLMNVAIPLQIGARDLAFPFLNALSFWLFLTGGMLVNISFLLGGSPEAGWTSYAPLAIDGFTGNTGNNFYAFGVQVSGIGTIMTAINFIVTIVKMRAPGMTMLRMPLFTWGSFITVILILFAFPALAAALVLLTFDNILATDFYTGGPGQPLLWQHLFWIFGHPEVYIIILPAFGLFSDIISHFARKAVFGYMSMIIALGLIAFLGFMVWVHHMFTVGYGVAINAIFAISTMLIAVPTGIKVFNWLFTIRGGSVRFPTPMLFALGFIPTFVMGGVTGVMVSMVSADYQYHDSYFVVGHFHYVMVGGTLMGIFAGLYYWMPKMFGLILNETLGKIHFWTFLVGLHLTFFPMHLAGLNGMPRRVYTYLPEDDLFGLNFASSIGAIIMAFSTAVFLFNLIRSFLKKEGDAEGDAWGDGRNLEWSIPSPAPEHRWSKLPVVRSRDPFWAAKEQHQGRLEYETEAQPYVEEGNTILPVLISGFFFVASFGFIFGLHWVGTAGIALIFATMIVRSLTFDKNITLSR